MIVGFISKGRTVLVPGRPDPARAVTSRLGNRADLDPLGTLIRLPGHQTHLGSRRKMLWPGIACDIASNSRQLNPFSKGGIR